MREIERETEKAKAKEKGTGAENLTGMRKRRRNTAGVAMRNNNEMKL